MVDLPQVGVNAHAVLASTADDQRSSYTMYIFIKNAQQTQDRQPALKMA